MFAPDESQIFIMFLNKSLVEKLLVPTWHLMVYSCVYTSRSRSRHLSCSCRRCSISYWGTLWDLTTCWIIRIRNKSTVGIYVLVLGAPAIKKVWNLIFFGILFKVNVFLHQLYIILKRSVMCCYIDQLSIIMKIQKCQFCILWSDFTKSANQNMTQQTMQFYFHFTWKCNYRIDLTANTLICFRNQYGN